MNQLSRRDFFCSLAASVVVAKGISYLPIGFPDPQRFVTYTTREFLVSPDDYYIGDRARKIIIHIQQWHSEFGITEVIDKIESHGHDIRTGNEVITYDR